MTAADEYILGTDAEELARLGAQHAAWREHTHALWRRAGLRAGDRVLDLGCGPGFTSLDLAEFVGPTGRVRAVDVSAPFLGHLEEEAARRGLAHVETACAPVEALDAQDDAFDAAYARWLFCWLADPGPALARVARAVCPGGVVALQEYLDWAAMSLVPRDDLFDRAVAACMRSWREGGGTIDLAAELPRLAPVAGLALEDLAPVARLGRIGSLEWRWMDGFFASYLPRLVARGGYDADEHAAFRELWAARAAEGTGWVHTPTMCDAVLRRR